LPFVGKAFSGECEGFVWSNPLVFDQEVEDELEASRAQVGPGERGSPPNVVLGGGSTAAPIRNLAGTVDRRRRARVGVVMGDKPRAP
jgi:hypothetical protein